MSNDDGCDGSGPFECGGFFYDVIPWWHLISPLFLIFVVGPLLRYGLSQRGEWSGWASLAGRHASAWPGDAVSLGIVVFAKGAAEEPLRRRRPVAEAFTAHGLVAAWSRHAFRVRAHRAEQGLVAGPHPSPRRERIDERRSILHGLRRIRLHHVFAGHLEFNASADFGEPHVSRPLSRPAGGICYEEGLRRGADEEEGRRRAGPAGGGARASARGPQRLDCLPGPRAEGWSWRRGA